MNIFLLIIVFFLIKNRSILGTVFFENTFLLGTDGWILTGNKLENTILHQPYSLQSSLQQQDSDNNGNCMSNYIIAKDDLINVDSKNKDDKNLWYFKSPPIKLTLGKPDKKRPMLLTFTLTSFMGDFRHLNRCHALIKIRDAKGDTFFYPYIKKYAQKIGADFYVIKERKFPDWYITYEKLQIYEIEKEKDAEYAKEIYDKAVADREERSKLQAKVKEGNLTKEELQKIINTRSKRV